MFGNVRFVKHFALNTLKNSIKCPCSQLSFLEVVLKPFERFTRKHICLSLLNKVIGVVISAFLFDQKLCDAFKNYMIMSHHQISMQYSFQLSLIYLLTRFGGLHIWRIINLIFFETLATTKSPLQLTYLVKYTLNQSSFLGLENAFVKSIIMLQFSLVEIGVK